MSRAFFRGPLTTLRERAVIKRRRRIRRRVASVAATGAAIVARRVIRKARSN